MAKVKVLVLRTMNGGEFSPGDRREMDSSDAERLAKRGAVRILTMKKAPAPKNKMVVPPANKSTG